ncbi:MAG: hypothetical protein ACO2Z9_01925 [Crocinitomicaceae bacterium]
MTYLQNNERSSTNQEAFVSEGGVKSNNEISINVNQEFYHANPMSGKSNSSSNSSELKQFVTDYFKSKGMELSDEDWVSENEVKIQNIPGLALHSLALRAEEQGKNISYERTLTIKISE